MVKLASSSQGCDAVVFGWVDISGSIGLGRDGIESEPITTRAEAAATVCKQASLDLVVGGAVSFDALENMKRFGAIHLSRFETRKVVFTGDDLSRPELEQALKDAVHFELL